MTEAPAAVPQRCASCHAELDWPVFCQACRRLIPLPEGSDYFALFRMPRGYDLDEKALHDKFLAVSRSVHPDYFSDSGAEMRQLAVRLSAELNEAYKVLSDPVLRARYLLDTSAEGDPSADRAACPEVLGEALTLREQIEDANASGDAETLSRLGQHVQAKRAAIAEEIGKLARRLPSAEATQRSRLRRLLNSVGYYDNLLEIL
jgi:molecular chaperone HscB